MACSPRQRILAWVLCCRCQRVNRLPLNGTQMGARRPGKPCLAKHFTSAAASASMTPWRRAAVRSWGDPGNAGEIHSS